MKPIPFRKKNIYQLNSFKESRLIFNQIIRSHVTPGALERGSDSAPAYLNEARMSTIYVINGHNVRLIDFILLNAMDPSHQRSNPTTSINFGPRDTVTFTQFRTAFNNDNTTANLPTGSEGDALRDVLIAHELSIPNAQERRNLEVSSLQPVNIDVLAYKCREVFAYNNKPLWTLLERSRGQVLSDAFYNDPAFAQYTLNSLLQCSPDPLLVGILRSIEGEIVPNTTSGTPRETAAQMSNRKQACSTLSGVCDSLYNYYTQSVQTTNTSSAATDVMNPNSAIGIFSRDGLMSFVSSGGRGLIENFNRLSGGEKAITVIGALVFGRAIGHNNPKISAAVKTGLVAALAGPMAWNLGRKIMTGRSQLEVRKITALLGGTESGNAEQLLARICGFTTEQAGTPEVKRSVNGFIDSIVKHETFASFRFRDVINTFAGDQATSSDPISFGVLGSLNAYPDVSASLSSIIPKLVAKYESSDTDRVSRIRYHQVMNSSRTWSEGMYFLMRNSAELTELLAQDEMETKVTQSPDIRNLNTDLDADLADTTNMGVDTRVRDHISMGETAAIQEDRLQSHINQRIQADLATGLGLSGHYHSHFFHEFNGAQYNTSSSDPLEQINHMSQVSFDGTFYYASFQIDMGVGRTYDKQTIVNLYNKVKSLINNQSGRDSLRLVFSGSPDDDKRYLIAGFSWIKNGLSPNTDITTNEAIDINREQLVSLDNNTFGNRALRLYTNIFRDETQGNSDILPIIQDPGSITLTQINSKLPENFKIDNNKLRILKLSLGALKSFAPAVMNIVSVLFSSAPGQIIEVLTSDQAASLKVLRIYRLWRQFSVEGVSTERDRRIAILNKYLDVARTVISEENPPFVDFQLGRAKAILEYYALFFTCREIVTGSAILEGEELKNYFKVRASYSKMDTFDNWQNPSS